MVQSYKNESKSQLYPVYGICERSCDVWYKVTKMRANHNQTGGSPIGRHAVMYGTKLQKWEQITTKTTHLQGWMELWCMVQSYKNESKSQLLLEIKETKVSCDVWYKVTKMRANHNYTLIIFLPSFAVMYGTKLQKWEQITTVCAYTCTLFGLWCMVQSYKNESKSQLNRPLKVSVRRCDVWYKVTKMRANHN